MAPATITPTKEGVTIEQLTDACWKEHGKVFKIAGGDLELIVSSHGATLISLKFKGKEMTLNHEDADFFDEEKNAHYGATCGRVAGRIANAKFTLDNGKSCNLTANNGPNSLHGGPAGFSRV